MNFSKLGQAIGSKFLKTRSGCEFLAALAIVQVITGRTKNMVHRLHCCKHEALPVESHSLWLDLKSSNHHQQNDI